MHVVLVKVWCLFHCRNFAYPGDDDQLNGYNPDKLEARRENFMSDDRFSVSDWSRKTSAEGGRQYNQSELEPDYYGRYPDSGNSS